MEDSSILDLHMKALTKQTSFSSTGLIRQTLVLISPLAPFNKRSEVHQWVFNAMHVVVVQYKRQVSTNHVYPVDCDANEGV